MAMAFAISGGLLNATGFEVSFGGNQSESTFFFMRLFDVLIPAITSLLAILTIATFSITEAKAHEIRLELEQRRGSGLPAN
jgi:GPH family glycoside/pentoside/hexuronide:cation symporter